MKAPQEDVMRCLKMEGHVLDDCLLVVVPLPELVVAASQQAHFAVGART